MGRIYHNVLVVVSIVKMTLGAVQGGAFQGGA